MNRTNRKAEPNYPLTTIEDPQRPYRLWDANAKKAMRWRCYKHVRNAHLGALVEARWAAIDTVIEVYDARTAKMLGQYRRRVNDIYFLEA